MISDLIPPEQEGQFNEDFASETADNSNYHFVTGELDPDDKLEEFLEDFQKPKEDTGIPADLSDLDEEDLEEQDEVNTESAKHTAEFIVQMTDNIFAHGLAWFSHNPVEQHKAGKEQLKYLKKLWTAYLKEKNLEIPLGYQILFALATYYGSQIPAAYTDRQLNLKRTALEEDTKRLNEDRKRFEEEKEYWKIRKEAEKLNNGKRTDTDSAS